MDHGIKLKSISFDLYFSHSRNNWLVLSFLCIFLSLSLSLFSCNFIRARPCSRHVFAREANNRGIMVYGRERVVDSRLRKRGVSRAETGKPG